MRTQILHAEAAPYLGFARRLWRSLEDLRLMSGAVQLQKYVVADNIRIFLRCCEDASLIRIEYLGAPEGHILLSSLRDGATHFSTLDYIKNKTGVAAVFPDSAVSGVLSSMFDQTCQVGEHIQVKRNKTKWSVEELGGEALEFIGRVDAYEQAYFAGTDGIWMRHSQGLQQVSNIPSGHLLLPSLSGSFLNLFSFASYPTAELWNQYRGASLFSITPTNGVVQEYGAWVPSFFVVEPTDTYGLKPGWYYGRYPSPRYDTDNPLESLSVSLCAVVDTRCHPGLYAQGWCEMVTAVNGEDRDDIYFYFDSLTTPGNDYAYRELVTGSYTHSFITIGSVLAGHSTSFSLTATTAGVKPDEVKLWNFESYTSGTSTSIDAVGVLVIEGTRCRGYRYKGYAAEFVDTTSFHSYAISNNGQMVAIFESIDGSLITSVKVYDLFGVRGKALTGNPDYSEGGHTLVRDSGVVAPLAALTACFIPTREKDFTPGQAAFLSVSSPNPDNRAEFPSLSSLRFTKSATGGLQIDKVVCDNGVDATFGVSSDPCFDSTIVVDDPHLVATTDRLVSKWDAGGNFRGVVRGVFEGTHPNMRFRGVGSGSSGWYGEISLASTFSMVLNATEDGFVYSGYSGELIYGEGLNEDGTLNYDTAGISCAPAGKKFSASSSCGQTAEAVVVADEFSLTGTSTPIVGSAYSAGGGVPPYSYSFSGGGISNEGKITSINGCSAPRNPRWATVSATDACGQTAEIEVRLAGGVWVSISDENNYGQKCVVCGENKPSYGIYNPGSITCAPVGGFYYWYSWTYLVPNGCTKICELGRPCPTYSFRIINRIITYEWKCP